jgi:hypothetical protein
MNIRTICWVLGATCLTTGSGLAISACSSTPAASPGGSVDSGSSPDPDTGSPAVDTGVADPDAGGGGGSDCGSTPYLHPGDGGSLYCPFGPDGSAIDCPTGSTICCIGGEISRGNYAVSQCGTVGQTCPNPLPDGGKYPARPVECEEANDCVGDAGPRVCCATGGTPAMDTACGYFKESPGFTATTCTPGASCPAGQYQMCAHNTECTGGQSCAAFKALGIQLGFCQ